MTPTGKIQKFVLREEVEKGVLTFDEVRGGRAAPSGAGTATN
jgi:fatty-acyl-CoA synthase